MRTFLIGILTALVVVLVVALAAVWFGLVPAAADGALLPGERWAAHTSLNATLAREAPKPPYPVPETTPGIIAGARIYAQDCTVCHGSAKSGENSIAAGLGVPAPQFGKHGVADDPAGVTYWKVEHGVRFTGMPSFGRTMSQQDVWDVAYFLSHKPETLPAAARAIWNDPAAVPAPTPVPAQVLKAAVGTSQR